MTDKILRFFKKLIPRRLFKSAQPAYHYTLSLVGAIIYRFPSKKIKVIAVTGTKGKTSTTEILAKILETAGYKVATTSTLQFRIGDKINRNLYKMSMPGRMFMQKFLRQAVNSKCDFAILETTSEGAKMYRHKFIDFDGLIFTNISPEHIESHGSYEKYLEAKLSYATALEKSSKKNKILVVNADDKEAGRFFQQAPSVRQVSFTLYDAEPFQVNENGSTLTLENEKITTRLPGKFNIYNILGAAKMASAFGVSVFDVKKAIESLGQIRGRVEYIKVDEVKQDFEVIVDYAHTADSMEQFYQTFSGHNLICVFGATGGGRDQWKRSEMGKVADKYCSQIILTDDDSYDEKPEEIATTIAEGIKNHVPQIIADRRLAIREALSKAKPGDIVALTGKGSDPFLMGPNGSKQKWDDAEVVREELKKLLIENL